MHILKEPFQKQLGFFTIHNEIWTCPHCEVSKNSVEWFRRIEKAGKSFSRCPSCKVEVED